MPAKVHFSVCLSKHAVTKSAAFRIKHTLYVLIQIKQIVIIIIHSQTQIKSTISYQLAIMTRKTVGIIRE